MTLRILQSVDSLAAQHGGPSRSIVQLSEALARRGTDVTLITRQEPHGTTLVTPDKALARLSLVSGLRDRQQEIARHLDAPGPALLHDNGLWLPSNWIAARTARRLGRPYVISPHGALTPWALAWHPWRKRLALALFQHRLLAQASGLIASAEPERAGIRRLVQRPPIAVIANGIALPDTIPEHDFAPESPRTLLFLSRLHPVKNLPSLISAWARLLPRPEFRNWQLVIAGPEEVGHRAELDRQVESLGPAPRISFAGPVPDERKSAVYASADLFILPSNSENFGLVVAEALAHGRPVITTTGTPWSDLPALGAGWWTAPTAEALADAMAEAMALPAEARAAMGRRGAAMVASRYGWPQIAGQTLAFYQWLVSGGPKPPFVDA